MAVVLGAWVAARSGLAGADPRRHEPEERVRDQPARSTGASAAEVGLAEPQPERVEADERPPLGPDQAAGRHEQERLELAAVEQAVDRPERDADQHRLRGAAKEVVEPVLGEHDADHRQQRPRAPRANRRRPAGWRGATRPQAEQTAGAGGDHPQRRSGAAERPVDVVKITGSGFHDGPAADDEAQVRVGDLRAPDDPRPRVVAGDGRQHRGRQQPPAPRRRAPPARRSSAGRAKGAADEAPGVPRTAVGAGRWRPLLRRVDDGHRRAIVAARSGAHRKAARRP